MMKSIFNQFPFLIFVLLFINNSVVAKAKNTEILNKSSILTEIFNDTIKQKNVTVFSSTTKINNLENTYFRNNSPTKGRFEIGVELGVFSTDVEYSLFYKEFSRAGDSKIGYELHHSMINGLSFTHILNKKWWLQTGIRYGRSTWSEDVLFYSSYDDSFEQIQPDGEVRYDLTLVSSGNINEVEAKINVTVTNPFSLDNGSFVASSFLVEKRLEWLQIPIGLEYRLGKNRLNYTIKGGLSLNQITTSNYNFDGLTESSNSRLIINEIVYPPKDNVRFLGAYLGAGLRYNLKENIVLSTHFNFRYEDAIKVFTNDVFTGFHFGASYLL